MARGTSSFVILITLFIALLIMGIPASASNTTTEITVATNQTTVPPTETTVAPAQTTVAATQTSIVSNQTTAGTTQTRAAATKTIVATTHTTARPTKTTVAVTQPTTVVTTANPATPVTTTVTSGAVNVYSSPIGAGVLIDGVYYGTTPKTVQGVPAGNHILRLTLSGYTDYEGSIYVVAGQTAQGYGTLQPLSQVVSAAPTATVVVPVIVPVVTATPEPTQDTGLLGNSGVLAAIIGAIAVAIASFASIYTHGKPPKKE
jgi:hypothetical protein